MKTLAAPEKDVSPSGTRSKFIRRIPLLTSLIFGSLWAFMYFFFGRMHAMWQMFDKEFPLVVAAIVGVHKGNMSPLTGVLFAFADGMIVGGVLGFLFSRLLVSGGETSP